MVGISSQVEGNGKGRRVSLVGDVDCGLAIHIAPLRHPGQGWLDDTEPPAPLVAWLAEQIDVPFPALARYGTREATRSSHRRLATRHLGLRAFVPAYDMQTAMDLAARAAFDTGYRPDPCRNTR